MVARASNFSTREAEAGGQSSRPAGLHGEIDVQGLLLKRAGSDGVSVTL